MTRKETVLRAVVASVPNTRPGQLTYALLPKTKRVLGANPRTHLIGKINYQAGTMQTHQILISLNYMSHREAWIHECKNRTASHPISSHGLVVKRITSTL
jgi:hypothetical protein